MSWLFWVLLVLVAVCALQGARKGLVRTAVSMVAILLVIGTTGWLSPHISQYIIESTQIDNKIEEKCNAIIMEKINDNQEMTDFTQVQIINDLPLPEVVKEKMIQNNNISTYQSLAVERFGDYVSAYLTRMIVNGAAFVVAFLITIILLHVILHAVDLVTKLPVVNEMNRFGGLLLGAVQGIVWVWIIFWVITLLGNTPAGEMLIETIRSDRILNVVYDWNVLMWFVISIFG